jgi:hypothetical protein
MKYILPKTDLRYFDESVNSLIESHSKSQLRVEIYKAIAAEREACAQLCIDISMNEPDLSVKFAAHAIRARSNT